MISSMYVAIFVAAFVLSFYVVLGRYGNWLLVLLDIGLWLFFMAASQNIEFVSSGKVVSVQSNGLTIFGGGMALFMLYFLVSRAYSRTRNAVSGKKYRSGGRF